MADKRFNCRVQAVVRTAHGQQFTAYWFLGRRWDGVTPDEAILTEDEVNTIREHQKAGFPIKLLSAEEIVTSSSAPVVDDLPPPVDDPPPASDPLPVVPERSTKPKAPWEA